MERVLQGLHGIVVPARRPVGPCRAVVPDWSTPVAGRVTPYYPVVVVRYTLRTRPAEPRGSPHPGKVAPIKAPGDSPAGEVGKGLGDLAKRPGFDWKRDADALFGARNCLEAACGSGLWYLP